MMPLTTHDNYEMVTFNLVHYWLKNRRGRHFRTIEPQQVYRQMKIAEIKDALKATVLAGEDQMGHTITGAGSADLMEDVLAAATEGCALLTGVVTEQVIRTAKVAGVGAVVFVRGKQPEKRVIDLAASYKIPLLITRYSLFVASGKLYMEGLRGLDGSW
jgi:predicted transcriptional regulator